MTIVCCLECLAEEPAFAIEMLRHVDVMKWLGIWMQPSSAPSLRRGLMTYHVSRLLNLLMTHGIEEEGGIVLDAVQDLIQWTSDLEHRSSSLLTRIPTVGAREMEALFMKAHVAQIELNHHRSIFPIPPIPTSLNMWHAMDKPTMIDCEMF